MSISDNLSLVDRTWISDVNNRARDSFLRHHSDDIVVYDPSLPKPSRGREALGTWFDGLLAMFPDYHVKRTRVFGQEGWVCLEVEETGTMKGPIHAGKSEIPPTGKSFKIPSSIICHIENGVINEVRVYYDLMGLMAQLGLGR
jgi:steroid delta-isomerase-like uncharacterized protein